MWMLLSITIKILFLTALCEVPNFVVILTDDQDLLLNGLIPMQYTLKTLANEGKTFSRAFVNSPICCPSRSTLLTGKYAHNHRVINNSISGNCFSLNWQQNHEPFTFPSILQQTKNYSTFYAGKYLNQYGSKNTGGTHHVPTGYDWWIGLKGNSQYYNYTLSINGSAVFYENDYLTDVLSGFASDFLDHQDTVQRNPFLMVIAPPASHAPFTPAPRHEHEFANVTVLRNPSFNYSSHDKHWLVRMQPNYLPSNVSNLDSIQRKRMQTLLAVDELVEKLVGKLKLLELLKNTYIMLISDNGFHIGQFTQPWDKRQPYETDIRVPFIIRGPNIPKKSLDAFPVSAVDLAPTILDLADVTVPTFMDGKSFKKQLFHRANNRMKLERQYVLVEYWGEGNRDSIDGDCPWTFDSNLSECSEESWCKCQDSRNNTYTCLIRFMNEESEKFCQFQDDEGFIEVYDLKSDPNELNNLYRTLSEKTVSKYMKLLMMFKECSGIECLNGVEISND